MYLYVFLKHFLFKKNIFSAFLMCCVMLCAGWGRVKTTTTSERAADTWPETPYHWQQFNKNRQTTGWLRGSPVTTSGLRAQGHCHKWVMCLQNSRLSWQQSFVSTTVICLSVICLDNSSTADSSTVVCFSPLFLFMLAVVQQAELQIAKWPGSRLDRPLCFAELRNCFSKLHCVSLRFQKQIFPSGELPGILMSIHQWHWVHAHRPASFEMTKSVPWWPKLQWLLAWAIELPHVGHSLFRRSKLQHSTHDGAIRHHARHGLFQHWQQANHMGQQVEQRRHLHQTIALANKGPALITQEPIVRVAVALIAAKHHPWWALSGKPEKSTTLQGAHGIQKET